MLNSGKKVSDNYIKKGLLSVSKDLEEFLKSEVLP